MTTTTTPPAATRSRSDAITAASRTIRQLVNDHERATRNQIHKALDEAFRATEDRCWDTSDAHEACEAATAGMLFAEGAMLHEGAGNDTGLDALITRLAAGEPRIRGRAARHAQLQHYATPLRVGWAMVLTAGIDDDDVVLDPNAGTGTLLALAHLACPRAALRANEAEGIRAATLGATAPQATVNREDATTLADMRPEWRAAHDVVVMNPPASVRISDAKKHRGEDLRHVLAAAAMTRPGGRIVALLSGSTKPREHAWEKIIRKSVRLTWCALVDSRLAENREYAAGGLLCVLDNREEDDAFNPKTGTEHHAKAETLWAAARAAARRHPRTAR